MPYVRELIRKRNLVGPAFDRTRLHDPAAGGVQDMHQVLLRVNDESQASAGSEPDLAEARLGLQAADDSGSFTLERPRWFRRPHG